MIVKGEVFSNGTEYEVFNEAFCCRCKKYLLDKDGWPLSPANGGCVIEDKIESSALGYPFPADDVVEIHKDGKPKYYHVCMAFESDDADLMAAYRGLFE